MTKWLSVLEENSWFCYLFFPDFQFRDLRKINKDYERVKWEWWIFVSSHLQYCFFFSPLLSCFSTLLLPLFSLRKNKIKNGIHADLCDSKAEMKVWYPWFVIRYFFGPWTVPEEPTLRHLCDPLRSDWLPERALGPTLHPRDIPRLSRKKSSLCGHIINPLLTKFVRPRWLGIALVFLRFNFRNLCNFGRMHFL